MTLQLYLLENCQYYDSRFVIYEHKMFYWIKYRLKRIAMIDQLFYFQNLYLSCVLN